MASTGAEFKAASYLRDVAWSNIKGSTLKKVTQSRQSGTARSGEESAYVNTVDVSVGHYNSTLFQLFPLPPCWKPRLTAYKLYENILAVDVRKQGIPEVPSKFPFGSDEIWNLFTGKGSFIHIADKIYEQYRSLPLVGYIAFGKPTLVVNDLELAKMVMIKDFDHFTDRRSILMNEKVEANKIANKMLTNLKGDQWKQMRGTMSPVFTSGKLKVMFKLLHKVGKEMTNDLKQKNNQEFNAKDMFAKFMSDSMASCGFGVETNSFKDPDSEFSQMIQRATGGGKRNPKAIVKLLLIFNLPQVANVLRLSFLDTDVSDFFVNIINQTLEYRKTNKIRRNDFIDLTLDALKNEIKLEQEDDQFEKDAEIKLINGNVRMEGELEHNLIANLIILFFAGFDTSSTTLSMACIFLAKNPEIQERLYEEIMEKTSEEDDLEYNAVQSLPYLDMVVHETLRNWPLTFLERLCTIPYKIPGTDFTIPKGMMVQIPAPAMMKDPQYFPDPNNFNPENFSPENKAKRSPYSFLAFGQGPRNCIGMRFALLSVKLCLVLILKEFKIVPSENTPTRLETDPMSQSGLPKGGVNVKVIKRTE